MRISRTRKVHFYVGRLYVVESVPSDFCPDCGERIFRAETLKAIDRMLQSDHPVKETLTVEVVEMPDIVDAREPAASARMSAVGR